MIRLTAYLGLAAAFVCGLSSDVNAALMYRTNANTTALADGTNPVVFDVDLIVNWDGAGVSALSGIDFDVTMDSPITLPDDVFTSDPVKNPFSYSLARTNANSLGFANFAGVVAPFQNGDNRLTTMTFEAPADVAFGTYGFTLNLTNVTGDGFADVIGEFGGNTSFSGTLTVAAVPEPNSAALLATCACGLSFLRRRRR
ncbi:MAG TPA: hypothetical protein DDW52_30160 [Planctomycetaceae bacterium]|nr:hypothetical protein [Planctomycetaceae bacterium]